MEGAGGQECPPHTIPLRIADVGTGSGCIALALAKELPGAEIHATDVSAGTLEIARANAARHGLGGRIEFHQADLLAGLAPDFDFIVSNPPYVGESEEDQVQLEVRRYEPRSAVFAGPSGTEVIARLIPQALLALRPGGWLVLEISGTIVESGGAAAPVVGGSSNHFRLSIHSKGGAGAETRRAISEQDRPVRRPAGFPAREKFCAFLNNNLSEYVLT